MLFLDKCYLGVKRSHELSPESRINTLTSEKWVTTCAQRKQTTRYEIKDIMNILTTETRFMLTHEIKTFQNRISIYD